MKKILVVLLLLPFFAKAQFDTIGVMRKISKAGTFNIDTLKIPNNKTGVIMLSLIGKSARAVKVVTVSNTNGVYKIVSNLNPIAFSGLTGGKFEVVLVNKIVVVKITGTKDIIPWELTKLNIEYK